jgi:gamma-glutamyltranspeptidase/glutathione hydrolase
MHWNFPYRSQRMPVLAANVVATGQPLAAQAGLQVLVEGGTAADAAVCAAATLTVVEPTANGIGSDAFALSWDGELQGLNASGRSPAGLVREAFGTATEMPRLGWNAVTVPGCVSAWVELHKRHGTLPFERLLAPAIRYATEGYPVSPMAAAGWERAVKRYKDFPAWMATFAPNGRAPATSEMVKLPDHAATLRDIARTGGESFYRGAIADRIDAAARKEGGAMRAEDLRAHSAQWVEPWSVDYRDVTLHEIPPNGQGLAALVALGILRHTAVATLPPDGADSLHLQIEAMRAAFVDVHRHVADPDLGTGNARQLLEPAYLQSRAAAIRMDAAGQWNAHPFAKSSTVYLAAADAQGHMVSWIQSNYEGFGSGIVVPGTGIAMQNRGAGFTLERGHPNEYAPGKRPFHTIIPAFLTRRGQPLAAFGVMGGPMQPQGHVQVVLRMVDQGLNPQSAIDAPRWQVMDDGSILLELGFPESTVTTLAARGHRVRVDIACETFFGGAQMAWRGDGSYIAASDPRRDGQAVGY